MLSPIKLNLKIYQGSTFRQALRWESSTKVYIPIVDISKSAPLIIQTAPHIVPVGWRVKITHVQGMKELNSPDIYHTATGSTPTSITLNQINSLNYSTYTGGGVVEYNQPVDLAQFSARMQIRQKLNSAVLHELTSQNGGIVFDNEYKTITLFIDAISTSEMSFTTAVYNLELIYTNEVTNFAVGTVTLLKEVTK